jgi:putative ABC transport system substrate-binding protein
VLLVTFLLLLVPSARGANIAIVLSSRIRAYDEAVQAFQRAVSGAGLTTGPKTVGSHTFIEIAPGEDFLREVRARKPDLILAVGGAALSAVGEVRDVPVVFLLTPGGRTLAPDRSNVTGVEMELPASAMLGGLIEALPGVHRVGLVHDPRRSAALVRAAREFARQRGLTLVAQEAAAPREVASLISEMKGSIDAYWMLPDLTVTTPETVEALVLFSLESRVPILTFSEKFLELGAAVAVVPDLPAMGEQAGKLARRILSGAPAGELPSVLPARFKVRLNQKVAKKLGLELGTGLSGSGD